MRAALVMPTLDAGPLLDRVLAGVAAQRSPGFAELVAIDSGSTDGTRERLERAGFRVAVIPRAEFDHGSTRDRAIAMTTAEVVVLLTQDAVPLGEDWLRSMLEPFADPRTAAVWCRQVPRPDCPPVIARRIREWLGDGDQPRVQELAPGETLENLAPAERLRRCALDNVASALRRAVWERFPLGPRRFGEDLAFGMRAIAAGYRIVYQPRAVVEHSHSRTPFAEGKRTFCDHRNLREMVGLVTIPDWRTLRAALRDGTREHLAYVDSLGLPEPERTRVRRWTRAYVRWQCWAQYLGAKAGAKPGGLRGFLLARLGRRLERGVG
ncbi:MAG TPA: glycosyltransferase family 2 protein [Planctomycetota bacterium]|nr:glycosyltransferase family 2 protein [Planctomycetota bacterium]